LNYINWTAEELLELQRINNYSELVEFALEKLEKLPKPVIQVCGPLTTGGRGSFSENLKHFGKAIDFLNDQGRVVFDQRPFETPFRKLENQKVKQQNGYDTDLLEKFYLPLFESGRLSELYFLPGWEYSTGARWEHDQAKRLGIKISYASSSILV